MNMDCGIICLLDVLGVKRIYERLSPYEYLAKMEKIKDQILKAKEAAKTKIGFDFDIMFISDTLFILSKPSNVSSEEMYLKGIIEIILYNSHLLSLIINTGINYQIFLRGAITCSPFLQKDKFIVGPAIDEVAEEFEETNWIGVHATKKLSDLLESYKNDLIKQPLYRFIKYNVPFKKDKESRYCINWPKFILDVEPKMINPRNFIVDNLNKNSFTGVKKVDEDIKIKHNNTLNFFDHCSANYVEKT